MGSAVIDRRQQLQRRMPREPIAQLVLGKHMHLEHFTTPPEHAPQRIEPAIGSESEQAATPACIIAIDKLEHGDPARGEDAEKLLHICNRQRRGNMLQRDMREQQIDAGVLDPGQLGTGVFAKLDVRDIGIQLPCRSDHARRHIDADNLAEMARQCARQPPCSATEINGQITPQRVAAGREHGELAVDFKLAGGEELLRLPTAAALVTLRQHRP